MSATLTLIPGFNSLSSGSGPKLKLAHKQPESVYSTIPLEARQNFDSIRSAISRMSPTFQGSFSTHDRKAAARVEAQRIESLCKQMARLLK